LQNVTPTGVTATKIYVTEQKEKKRKKLRQVDLMLMSDKTHIGVAFAG